jgi:NAD(P)-dependent dehydrogenase (short-subunit alcohol dehydrogenase family)
MSKFDLAGRKALVTGGARGLGAGMAAALSKAGAAVMIGDVLTDVGRETAKASGQRRQGRLCDSRRHERGELAGCGFSHDR